MSVAVKEILRASRPPGPPGRAEKHLPDIAQDLRGLLAKCQRAFPVRSVVWPGESLSELAAVLQSGIGLEMQPVVFSNTRFLRTADRDFAQ